VYNWNDVIGIYHAIATADGELSLLLVSPSRPPRLKDMRLQTPSLHMSVSRIQPRPAMAPYEKQQQKKKTPRYAPKPERLRIEGARKPYLSTTNIVTTKGNQSP
jgi:hypothetical protein